MTTTKRLHLESLLGRVVRDRAGRKVGRIEELIVEARGGQCRVKAYLLGPGALFSRLSVPGFAASLLHIMGARSRHLAYRVPWDQLDLSDARHPHLRCPKSQLERIDDQGHQRGAVDSHR